MDLKQPQHDELHFIKTIHLFGDEISLTNIKHYEEMSTPLPFIAYALWGRIFGFDLYNLRILSIIIALITYLLYHRLLFIIFKNGKIALFTTLYLVIVPYMVALSFLVYTDMMAMLFLILSCIAIVRRNHFGFAIAAACALLCRQYLGFILLASAIYYLIRFIRNKERHELQMLGAVIISFLPLIFIVFLWKGLTPDNNIQHNYLDEKTTFHINFLILYICLFPVYLFPIIALTYRYFYRNVKILMASFVMSWVYWLFPVTAAKPMIKAGVNTAGFFHYVLDWLFENKVFVHIGFHMAFLLGLPIVFCLINDIYRKWRKNEFYIPFFFDLSILAFLLVMPFSYLVWEKYFMLIIPLASLRLLLLNYEIE